MAPVFDHPCPGDICARRDGITCGPDCCDLEVGIYIPTHGELTPAQGAYLAALRTRRETDPTPQETNPMHDPMTEVQFAQQVGFLAKTCASWSSDMLGPKEAGRLDQPVDAGTVERFSQEVRVRLARIETWAGVAPADPTESRIYHHALASTKPDESFADELARRDLGRWSTKHWPHSWVWDRSAVDKLSRDDARDLYGRITASPS